MRYPTLQQWLDWQQTLHPKAIDMSLERIAKVAGNAGIDDQARRAMGQRIITVGGTNGKGSCVKALEQMLLAQGKSVGAFTSPHVLKYNERIRINGQDADDEAILAAFNALDSLRENISLTYFEFATLAAAWLFFHQKLDYWLLEVGLGGRLDSVNIWSADVAIITAIDIDHVQWLGDNRYDIGREKAGIFRPQQIAICADTDPPASIAEQAKHLGTQLYQADIDFGWSAKHASWQWWGDSPSAPQRQINLPQPALPEPSVAAAIMALQLLNELPGEVELYSVVEHLQLTGRFQYLQQGDWNLILDVAHNPHAARLLAERLRRIACDEQLLVLFAAMADKDLAGIVAPLADLVDLWLLPNLQGLARAASNEVTADAVAAASGRFLQLPDMKTALSWLAAEHPERLCIVFGSFHTVDECLTVLNSAAK